MSYTPSEIIARVIEREGGSKITNDPSDPGGLTKYGISARSNPDLEIEKLTLNDAVSIYHKRYWKPSKVEHLKFSLQEMYFDMFKYEPHLDSDVDTQCQMIEFAIENYDEYVDSIKENAEKLKDEQGPMAVQRMLKIISEA